MSCKDFQLKRKVDELIVMDIEASVEGREPNYKMIENLAAECRMPLCYGGGIKTVEQAQKIFSLGVEKIAINSVAINTPEIIGRIAERVGSQSVIVVMDVKKCSFKHKYEIFTQNGKIKTGLDPVRFAKQAEEFGAGEIVLNSIDNDGVMKGYDFDIINNVREAVTIPMTIIGGAGSLENIGELIRTYGINWRSCGKFVCI